MTQASDTQPARGTLAIPEGAHRIPPTLEPDLDRAIEEVTRNAKVWVDLDVPGRLSILEELREATFAVAARWVDAACEAKRIPRASSLAAEEWLAGPSLVLRNLRLLARTLNDIQEVGQPRFPGVDTRPDGTVTVQVTPADGWDNVLLRGFEAEVWMQSHVTEENLHEHVARIYQPGHTPQPRVGLVLGAGNVSSIGPMDVLYKLFVEDEVVVLKMNQVNEWSGPMVAEAFGPLVRRGFLRIVYGGSDVGAYLTSHGGIDTLHITGSDKTHDAIVFGPGDEGRKNKANGQPVNTKPLSSELGNVTPVIVVPGPWSDREVEFHSQNIATMLVNNAGFNCIAARVLVTHRQWARRRALLDGVRDVLRSAPQRHPYYPGAEQRWQAFVDEHPQAERFGVERADEVPWTFIPELDADNEDDIAFSTEAFCGVFGEVPLDATQSVPDFLDRAVAFCNDRLWGTLSACILIHPRQLRDPDVALAADRAIAELRYGSVVVNHWAAVAYGLVSTTWGAYPGHGIDDIQSGRGVVHNSFLLEDASKSVVRGPFTMTPKPLWFTGHRNAEATARTLCEFEADPSPARIPRLLWNALRG
ncbi:MAG TPA: aldehyde dehydrogenase family protein [Nitriliruptorales bacterium]